MAEEQDALMEAARCFACLSKEEQENAQTYIYAYVAGVSMDPSTLADLASCFSCASQERLEAMRLYLLSKIGSLPTDGGTIMEESACYRCIPDNYQDAIVTQILSEDPSGPGITDPSALVEASSCFRCLSSGQKLAVQVYNLAVLASVPPTPDDVEDEMPPSIPPVINNGHGRGGRTVVIRGVGNGGGLRPGGGCHDVAHTLIPIITAHYTAGALTSIDIVFPKVCCHPYGYIVYESANADMSGATEFGNDSIDASHAGEANYTVNGIDVTGIAGPYVAAKQVCQDLSESAYSNVLTVAEPACAAGQTIAEDWADRVVANGAARPAQATIDAGAKFWCDLIAAGIDTKMKHVNIIAPDSLTAVYTPFHRAGAGCGSDIYTVTPGANVPSVDVDGFKFTGGGGGCLEAFINTNTCFSTDDSVGVSMYVTADTSEYYWGGYIFNVGNTPAIAIGRPAPNANYAFGWDTTSLITTATAKGVGFYSYSKTAAATNRFYFAKSTSAFALIGSTATPDASARSSNGYWGWTAPRVDASYGANLTRFSFWALHDGLDATESEALYNAVQALRTALGGGYV